MSAQNEDITVYLPDQKRFLLLTSGDISAIILGTCLATLCIGSLVNTFKERRSSTAKVEE